jgi:hypothetical protein
MASSTRAGSTMMGDRCFGVGRRPVAWLETQLDGFRAALLVMALMAAVAIVAARPLSSVAPRRGFEPRTYRLTAGCSTVELSGNGDRQSPAPTTSEQQPPRREASGQDPNDDPNAIRQP